MFRAPGGELLEPFPAHVLVSERAQEQTVAGHHSASIFE
jgi:hypothetical protein